MGGKKAQTIGYHYPWAWHFGWTRFADSLLEVQAGGATAWQGRVTDNTVLAINKPDLWGGEKGQGGMVGDLEVLFGGPTQAPSSYLASTFGAKQTGNRGLVSTIWKGGRFGAFLANPKPVSMKFERIHAGSVGWYPEKAAVPLIDGYVVMLGAGWEYQVETFTEPNTVWNNFTVPTTGWQQGGELPFSTNGMAGGTYWTPTRSNIWFRRQIHVNAVGLTLNIAADNGCVVWIDGVNVGSSNPTNTPISGNDSNPVSFVLSALGTVEVVVKAFSEINSSDEAGNVVTLSFSGTPLLARNPAHMIHEALVHPEMAGEPEGLIDNASFEAAADQLYLEGFGLCTTYDSAQETPWDYITRICSVIGAECTQSRLDGKYYLDLVRGGYDVESLPIITEDDILEFKAAPAGLETINSVSVEWHDPIKHSDRTTSPVFALGRVQAAGEIIQQIKRYREIPAEGLALRAAKRDLDIASPTLQRYELTVRRKHRGLRPGQPFRLQAPTEGIADAVLRLGSLRHGTHRDGRVRMVAVQDVFNLPDTVVVQPTPGDWVPPSKVPTAPPEQVSMEAPYVELSASMAPSDLTAVPVDAGYLLTAASLPATGFNYAIATAAALEDYVERATADFCPTALVVEAALLEGALPTTFTLSDGSLLDRVIVGSWALWGSEIVRVDAIDADAGTCTLGRSCADTVPAVHAAGERIWFCGDWVGSDGREYVDADIVNAKLLTRTSSGQLALADASALSVTLDQRQARPYPPGDFAVAGERWPVELHGSGVEITWAHRDRVGQADMLVDFTMASTGPEAGVTYTLENYNSLTDVLVHSEPGMVGTSFTLLPAQLAAHNRVELFAVRDGLESWQRQTAEFLFGIEITGQISGGANLESYSATLTATNATEPVNWSLCGGSLPPGLHVFQDGTAVVEIAGVPNATVGYYTTTLRAVDANGLEAEREFTIGVGDMLSLLHFDGANGSTTMTDETGRTWSRLGNSQIVTDGAALGGAQLRLDGNGDYLTAADSSDWAFATDDWSMEGFITRRGVGTSDWGGLFSQRVNDNSAQAFTFQYGHVDGHADFVLTSNGTTNRQALTVGGFDTMPVNQRQFARVGRKGDELFLLLGGARYSAALAPGFSAYNSNQPLSIGRLNTTGTLHYSRADFDEVRFIRGAADDQASLGPTTASDYPQTPAALAVSGALPTGAASTAYSSTTDIVIHGSGTPFSVSVSDGALPGDWAASVNVDKVEIVGSGIVAGDYSFTLEIEDSSSNVVELPLTVRVE